MAKYKLIFNLVRDCSTYIEASSPKEAVKICQEKLGRLQELEYDVEDENFTNIEVLYEALHSLD